MNVSPVFHEPTSEDQGPSATYGDFLRRSRTDEAVRARKEINISYAQFPDKDRQLLGNLQGASDVHLYQAIDELRVHNLASRSYERRYEEAVGSPDFRLYKDDELAASIEVISLFEDQTWQADQIRSFKLRDDINSRVNSNRWSAALTILAWRSPPRVADVARQVSAFLDSVEGASTEPQHEAPMFTYNSDEVELEFEFFPKGNGI